MRRTSPGVHEQVSAPNGSSAADHRARMLEGIPVREERTVLAGIPTALLVGGTGPPLVLLHGPGESAVNWRWVLPELVASHRVVAPDLPGHGATGGEDERLDQRRVLDWLEALVQHADPAPSVLVGHVLGGALAARYAADDPFRDCPSAFLRALRTILDDSPPAAAPASREAEATPTTDGKEGP